jgi:trk system potassium uptake protein TrkA
MRIHFAGGGQCAEYIARRLIREGHSLVLLELSEQRCRELQESLDAHVLHGSAVSIAAWRAAGLDEADVFIACTRSDEVNVVACLIADELAPSAVKVVRLRTPEFGDWQRMFEALKVRVDRIVHPESDVVARILRVLTVPGVSDVRDFAGGKIKLFSMNVEPGAWFAGRSLRELGEIPGGEDIRVCIILRGTNTIVPLGDETLRPGDHVYVITTAATLEQVLAFMGVARRERVRLVFIVGGGEVGLELARSLEDQKVSIKLFERDTARCDFLAEQLPATVVVNTDGTDQQILLRENVEGADAFISLTDNDDANLIACLLARRLGVTKVVPLLNRLNYLPLALRLGINSSVSPRVKAADAVFEFIRKGGVVSVRTLGEEAAEAIELLVPEGSRYAGRPLAELDIPPGAKAGAIARPNGEVFVPDGSSVINAGDRVVFFAQEQVVQRLESDVLAETGRSKWLRR